MTKHRQSYVAFCAFLVNHEKNPDKILISHMLNVVIALRSVAAKRQTANAAAELSELQKVARKFVRAAERTTARQRMHESMRQLSNALSNASLIAAHVFPVISTFPGPRPLEQSS